MDEPLAVALKFGFLAVLYLFLLWVARSAIKDLARSGSGEAAAAPPDPGGVRRREPVMSDLRAGVDPQLQVVAAMGHEPGENFDVARARPWAAPTARDQGRRPLRLVGATLASSRARVHVTGDMGSTNAPI